VLQAKARLNYCFLFKITLLWQLRFISKSEKEPIFPAQHDKAHNPACQAEADMVA
jgi:hypothetical protein